MSDLFSDIGGFFHGIGTWGARTLSEAGKFLFEPFYIPNKVIGPVADTASKSLFGMDIKTTAIVALGAIVVFSYLGRK